MGDNKIRLFLWDIQSRKMPEIAEKMFVLKTDLRGQWVLPDGSESVVFSTKSLFFVKPSLNSWPGGVWKEPIL